MTRISLLTAVCGLALAACSGAEDGDIDRESDAELATESETMDRSTDTTDTIDTTDATDANEPEAAPSTGARTEIDPQVATVVQQARACDVPEDHEITLAEAPEGPGDAQSNARASEAYISGVLSENCVFELPSGLVFRIREAEASGPSPQTGDMVTVHYRGMFPHGEEFDSSYARDEPATFPSDRLIRGWVEALPLMRVGERWELYIRPELGYGEPGTPGGPIGPNQALVFELELLDLP